MTSTLILIGRGMSYAGLAFHLQELIYRDSRALVAVVYFLVCAVASSMLSSAYEHYKEAAR
jgi:hypothetical protein